MRLTSVYSGYEHHVTVPSHNTLRVGTLNDILEMCRPTWESTKIS